MGGSSGVDLPSILRALKQTQSGGAERDGEAFATRLREALPALMENYFNPINGASCDGRRGSGAIPMTKRKLLER